MRKEYFLSEKFARQSRPEGTLPLRDQDVIETTIGGLSIDGLLVYPAIYSIWRARSLSR